MVPSSDIHAEMPGLLRHPGPDGRTPGGCIIPRQATGQGGISPQQAILPTAEMEAAGEVDWAGDLRQLLLRHRDDLAGPEAQETRLLRPGPLRLPGGRLLPGFLKPQLEFITHYVSTGIPGVMEGECYLESPEVTAPLLRDPRPPAGPGAVLRLQTPEPIHPRGETRGGDLFRPGPKSSAASTNWPPSSPTTSRRCNRPSAPAAPISSPGP